VQRVCACLSIFTEPELAINGCYAPLADPFAGTFLAASNTMFQFLATGRDALLGALVSETPCRVKLCTILCCDADLGALVASKGLRKRATGRAIRTHWCVWHHVGICIGMAATIFAIPTTTHTVSYEIFVSVERLIVQLKSFSESMRNFMLPNGFDRLQMEDRFQTRTANSGKKHQNIKAKEEQHLLH
jgi:hypothetical protein